MGKLGEIWRAKGVAATKLATYGGGALFTFEMAAVRFFIVGLS